MPTPKEAGAIACPFMQNGSLVKVLERVKAENPPPFWTPTGKAIIAWGILTGIEVIHAYSAIHRDIKPSNVFIGEGQILKIGDFGIAKILEHTGDLAKTTIGTPTYASPEVAQGKPYSFKADIWSLGCLLYEMLALRRPFEADEIPDILRKIVERDPRRIPGQYSGEVAELVGRLLTKDPELRPSINKVMKVPLVRNKAVALLGRTMARIELGHATLHEGLLAPQQDIQLAAETAPGIGSERLNKKVFREMQRMCVDLFRNVGSGKLLVELPDEIERLAPGDFYYMGRRLTLTCVKDQDTPHFKVEALRCFLESLVGFDKFRRLYELATKRGTTRQRDLGALPKSDLYLLQLVIQLAAYENTDD
jgi:hypothetical protein